MAKQSGGNTAQRVEALVRPTVEGMGLRLWDVVFEKEGPDWYLRVLIDKDGTALTKEELLARGMNQSRLHEDVMIGAEDSHITGKCRDGRTVELFRDGVWVL